MTTRRTTPSRPPDRSTVIKDIVSYLGGWALIIREAGFVPRSDFNLTLIILGAMLVGVPGVTQLLPWRTGSQPSPDQPEGSLSQSSLPSPNDLGDRTAG